jgi:hypothetical protein
VNAAILAAAILANKHPDVREHVLRLRRPKSPERLAHPDPAGDA